ncbi:MAG: magnesium chelatase [Dehalococcoidia bacterium]|nr:magnesium chelatase [Dehalococcoidia bacterium]MDW8119818.1 magnesium chelatase [Chloroflexota bacterium]
MAEKGKPKTIGELRRSGYQVLSVREELRKNLIQKLRSGERLFPGIIGYEDSVIPQIENAILAGQDIIFLGERGQAKSRLIRQLVYLLDEEVPVIAGCEINDNPYKPICKACRDKVAQYGDQVEIAWLPRERRYAEKLATPDVSIADLIGEVDPIKVAEGRYLADELTIHFGLIPRVNRGIFCINELPDLPERIQVGLFNLLEERDVQIRGYLIRLPLDVYVVASANPEDYTNRGRIITPLKDRYGAQIRTHYPRTIEDELAIVEQERVHFPDMDERVQVPSFMREIVGEFTALARRSPDINQRSGVSVRITIANYETLLAAALRRAIRYNEAVAVPRMSDLPFLYASTAGKLELETVEEGREGRIIEELLKKAVLNVFNRTFNVREFDPLVQKFEEGLVVETGASIPSFVYVEKLRGIEGFEPALRKFHVGENEALFASVVEFVLDGLHLNRRLNRERVEGRFRYKG